MVSGRGSGTASGAASWLAGTISFSLLALALAAVAGSAACGRAERPNVILIVSDDQGYADLGCQGVDEDVRTPNIDALAAGGVRMTNGYVTAPQCVPSRAGFLTGRYQNRFGVETNAKGPLPLAVTTIPERLSEAGYVTGMVGKWHLAPREKQLEWIQRRVPAATRATAREALMLISRSEFAPYEPGKRGFAYYFNGEMQTYRANYDLEGNDRDDGEFTDGKFRVDIQTEAALAFIRRHREEPFFLYLAYSAPHAPLEAPEEYLRRFRKELPKRRRYALAMIAAMDDGVGRILDTVREVGIEQRTLLFFMSDNGATLKMEKEDVPIREEKGAWNGSLNEPWLGEKGTLLEGGIRVPFIAYWRGVLPEGEVYGAPVISMDIAATALAVAAVGDGDRLDGVNLLPFITGRTDAVPHDALFWRWSGQAAVRSGRWKYLKLGDEREYLFDLGSDADERLNRMSTHPQVAAELAERLDAWMGELQPPGLMRGPTPTARRYLKFFLDRAVPPQPGGATRPQ